MFFLKLIIDPNPTPLWKYALMGLLMCGGSFQFLMPLFSSMGDLLTGVSPVHLHPDDMDTLQNVFFGGEPWLVLCRAKSDKHSSPAFFKSMSLIGGEGYEGRLNYGILDCDLPLPSNKTTLERFNLTVTGDIKKALPMFYVANGQPPKMLPHGYYATAERADALLKFVLQATKSRGWRSVKDAKGLRNCIKKKNCAVVLYPGKVRTDDDGGNFMCFCLILLAIVYLIFLLPLIFEANCSTLWRIAPA